MIYILEYRWDTNLAVNEFNSMHADVTRANNNQQKKVVRGQVVHSQGGVGSPKHTQPRIPVNGTPPQQVVRTPASNQKVTQPAVVKMPPKSQVHCLMIWSSHAP